ncbi:MAG TPA: hypothetical protein VFY39_12075 [Gammaproteobacteria bacterium]|nr:hypothetical protein [Gammaproteobacteria bacterium]
MGKRSSGFASAALRERLAQAAARLMIEHGIRDFGLAKRKAAERLGVKDLGALPSNAQIEASLAERQRIFEPRAHGHRLAHLRRVALSVMDELAAFQPRLVGSVLAGTATTSAPIELHAFSDSPETIAESLTAQGASLRDFQRRYRYNSQRVALVPGYRFLRDGAEVVVLTFPENGLREAPLSPVDQRPMKRAGRGEVAELLGASASAAFPLA